jgi:RNA polymerase sigma factor (sigma-70 family)
MFDILRVMMLTTRRSPEAALAERPMLLEASGDLAGPLQRLARARGQSPEAVAADLLRQALEREDRRKRAEAALAALTPRQRQVALLAAEGRTNREIARELWLSPETVKTHLRRALEHFGVHSKSELRLQLSDLVASDAAVG